MLVITRADWQVLRGLHFLRGDIIILIGIIDYAFYSVMLRRRPVMSSFGFLGWSFGLGLIMLFPLYLWELATVGGFALTGPAAASLLYVGIFPSILSYLCWNHGVAVLGSNRTGLFINLLPIFTAILSILFLGDHISWYHPLGLLFIFSGMLLFHRRRRPIMAPTG